jgi:hypothetical protein
MPVPQLRRTHPKYESARLVFIRAFDQRPSLIVRCAGPLDVVKSLEFAQRHNLRSPCVAAATAELDSVSATSIRPHSSSVWQQHQAAARSTPGRDQEEV